MDITDLFTDEAVVTRIRSRLPELFQIAELESSRAGKVGMEVGSAREKILIALLIHKFGDANIETNIPITEPEVDVKVFGEPVSIKTITRVTLGGVKLSWTVDAKNALEFGRNYVPSCDILLVQLNWNSQGFLYLFRTSAQRATLREIGRERYLKLPKLGTNPRGVEISAEALGILARHSQTHRIPIEWRRSRMDYDPYERWLTLWRREGP